ncbi:hypothetical protein [Paenibacillus odorifer]|uniref:hypothetical protein n=1 Tax=Paenibacillus odorifer TaxID=189426 RepID=UPI00117F2F54|nr:hypothetical protein [Paenibacillus odorifer]
MESHPIWVTLRFALRWTAFAGLCAWGHVQHSPDRAIIITTEGRRGPTASLRAGYALVATAERGNPELTARLG